MGIYSSRHLWHELGFPHDRPQSQPRLLPCLRSSVALPLGINGPRARGGQRAGVTLTGSTLAAGASVGATSIAKLRPYAGGGSGPRDPLGRKSIASSRKVRRQRGRNRAYENAIDLAGRSLRGLKRAWRVAGLRGGRLRPARLCEPQLHCLIRRPILLVSACRPSPRSRVAAWATRPATLKGRKSTDQKFNPTLRPFVLGAPSRRYGVALAEDGDSANRAIRSRLKRIATSRNATELAKMQLP